MGHHKELSVDDWRRIYEFVKYVELPFLHSVIVAAMKRNEKQRNESRSDGAR